MSWKSANHWRLFPPPPVSFNIMFFFFVFNHFSESWDIGVVDTPYHTIHINWNAVRWVCVAAVEINSRFDCGNHNGWKQSEKKWLPPLTHFAIQLACYLIKTKQSKILEIRYILTKVLTFWKLVYIAFQNTNSFIIGQMNIYSRRVKHDDPHWNVCQLFWFRGMGNGGFRNEQFWGWGHWGDSDCQSQLLSDIFMRAHNILCTK